MNTSKKLTVYGVLAAATLLAACQKQEEQPAAATGPQEPAIVEPSAAPAAPPQPATPAESAFAAADRQSVESALKSPCYVDTLNDKSSAEPVSAAADSKLKLVGWVSTSTKQVPQEFQVVLANAVGAYTAQGHAGYPRDDVATVQKSEQLKYSGYTVIADLAAVAPGDYDVSLIQSEGGKTFSCATRAKLTVTAAAKG